MGIKHITDKESWTDAKKIIACVARRTGRENPKPSSRRLSMLLWVSGGKRLAYYCKPPVSDLFVKEHRFDGKGFEMIAHIDHHFNPSGFYLIDIKQTDQESVVTLKARFSKAFSALKMGGIGINSALQVGFMLRALLSRYHAVV
jgi:hypothetical protein